MDAFFASVEQRANPEIRGRPVAVGGSRERGVVAAASYEARNFGVHSAMPSVTASRKCPELIFVKPRFDVYKEVSFRAIFAEHTPIIESLSLDEAYLDVTDNIQGIAFATEIADRIRAKVRAETNLPASAGVSYNKFLAKLASDRQKPDELFVITPAMAPASVEALTVGRFHGVGPVTAAKFEPARDFHRHQSQSANTSLPAGAVWQGGTTLLFDFSGHRSSPHVRQPNHANEAWSGLAHLDSRDELVS